MAHSASIRDHVRPRNQPYVQNEAIEARLQQLLSPVVYSQLGLYRQLGHRVPNWKSALNRFAIELEGRFPI